MRGRIWLAVLAIISLAAMPAADVIYLHCPTIFTKSISTITANYFKGNPPSPSCLGLNVTIDAQNAINTSCVSNGLMAFNLSTPVSKTYLINASSSSGAPWNGDGSFVTCTVRRSSFNVNITVPDLPLFLLPALGAASLLLLRRKK